ncbi:alpha/beta fold hydrolase [Idiomarina sp.]|uniref:alpha/beta hydrolase family protein n=1 Tax=Idiomarina sp. TaxID=1874361 RepID=UPI0025BCCEC8|nr:alpha/beta fold hydrolase [Idiomarina sp.]
MQSIELTANDRYVHCVRFAPQSTPIATVVIAAALGVKQRFYQPLAKWLSEQGYRVITFDYYGIGQSLDKPIQQIDTDIFAWAEQDIDAVLAYAAECKGEQPLFYLAHSLGGQLLALADNAVHIDKVVTVASGTGYWRNASKQVRRTSWLLWYFAVPISTPIAGYFPGKKLRMVGDMPANAMRQWSRWCRSKDYLFDHLTPEQAKRYRNFTAPIQAFHVSDDELLKRENIENLLAHYPNAPSTLIDLTPSMTPLKGIGHFNAFRREFQSSLWQNYLLPALHLD